MISLDSPIPISMDQSAMIAGFLMLGNFFAAPFSSWSFLGARHGILVGLLFMFSGWIVMWYADSIYHLLVSRFLIGMGNSYASGQAGKYISRMCDTKVTGFQLKIVCLQVCVGVVVAYCLGNTLDFRLFSVAAATITLGIFVLCALLPHGPSPEVRWDEVKDPQLAMKMLNSAEEALGTVRNRLGAKTRALSLTALLRDPILRRNFVLFVLLVFFQQFSGAPATIVYNQVIFEVSRVPFIVEYSVVYALMFLISNAIGMFYTSTLNMKYVLLFSGFSVTAALSALIAIFYCDLNRRLWHSVSLFAMLFYILFHSIGLACIPMAFVNSVFPKEAKKIVTQTYIMLNSALALIITKIFQVLLDRYSLYVPFCLFCCISVLSVIFVSIFIPRDILKLKR